MFQIYNGISAFLKFQKSFIWWVGWWVGCDFLPPSILLINRYVNKLDMLVTNMVLKLVNGFYMNSYDQLKFESWEF